MADGRYSPQYINRTCWWCPGKLATEGVKEIRDRDGNKVLVHRSCAEPALEEIHQVTAQPSEWPTSPAVRG